MAETLQNPLDHQQDIEALRSISTQAWENALTAAMVFTIGGHRIGGIHLRCRAGAVRNEWMDFVRKLSDSERSWQKITPQTSIDRLCGGIDLAATAKRGEKVNQAGILSLANEGTLIIALAEKLEGSTSAMISRAIDTGRCENPALPSHFAPARFSVIAIDEGLDESEGIPSVLKDRLGLMIDLNSVAYHHTSLPAPQKLRNEMPVWKDCTHRNVPDAIANLFADLSANFGNGSMRTLFHLTDTARVIATIDEQDSVSAEHAVKAIRLCLGIQLNTPAEHPPADETREQPSENQGHPKGTDAPKDKDDKETSGQPLEMDIEQLLELTVEAKAATTFAGIDLTTLGTTRDNQAASGRSGKAKSAARRGRPIGYVTAPPFPDAAPDLAATLRAAAPWQKIRRQSAPEADDRGRIIRFSDFRYKRHKHATRSAAIFAVDASGSTALERLGETKGAIELLFADCYVRRDEVGLISFRGINAETILEPTRSLVRAKRMLSDMAGGGPTPLADGIRLAFQTALNVRRQGFTPIIVLLTDGSANIDLNGNANRKSASDDTIMAARQVASAGIKAVCIDVSRRPRDAVSELAKSMGADYCPLPNANAANMSKIVSSYMKQEQA